MVNHRGPEFAELLGEVLQLLKPFFGSESEPLLLTGSGTGAQEAAIVNVLSPGDTVLSVTSGVFGDRFAAIAEAFGANVIRLQGEWGRAVTPESVGESLAAAGKVRAVLLTHNETSTGATNDIATIARVIREQVPDAVVLVDGVSSIGALPFELDAWGVDVAITGSQKAWMSPPGLAMVAVSERAWAAHRGARMPRFYWDFTKAQKNGEKRTTPFTPAVGIVQALQAALHLMHEEMPEGVFERHRRIGAQLREGLNRLGFELFAEPEAASNTVTAVRVPAGIESSALIKDLRKRGVVVASGQDWLKGSVFRIGHMGFVRPEDIDGVLAALEAAMTATRLEAVV
jgi:aspartate aminotransferase-like enzyme